ncbi:MAG: helix-turn-helix domain-containing protein [Treponema sp.]|jgi:AraC-like DNA-binding protein/ligand-binding sensor protein|nr:helix-turn-helix domain-containing protein [Treponema sp.]
MNNTNKTGAGSNNRGFLHSGYLKEPYSSRKRKTKSGAKRGRLQEAQSRTDPVLLKARKIIADYAKATGSLVCVQDHNYPAIPEISPDLLNTCLCCVKCQTQTTANKVTDPEQQMPCGEMHANAIQGARRSGGSCIYMCKMGFLFWTSPIYAGSRFIGALISSGFLGISGEEAAAQIDRMGKSPETEELKRRLSVFPRGDSQKIEALAELLLICAESLSPGTGDYYKTLRRRAEQQEELSAKIEDLKSRYPSDGPSPDYPLDKERQFLAALRQGDTKTARSILNEILAVLVFSNPDEFRFIQFRAIELVALICHSGSAISSEKNIPETSSSYLRQIRQAKNIEELTDTLYTIADRAAEKISSFKGIRHGAVLKKAEQYIKENFSRKISLKELADISGFSSPYFSTLFKEEMGENLSSHLNRLRVERALQLLIQTDSPLCKIAGLCGFEDQSWFSKTFKSFTGLSPGEFRSRQNGMLTDEMTEGNFSDAYRILIKK